MSPLKKTFWNLYFSQCTLTVLVPVFRELEGCLHLIYKIIYVLNAVRVLISSVLASKNVNVTYEYLQIQVSLPSPLLWDVNLES